MTNIQRQRGWNTPVKCEAIPYEIDVYRKAKTKTYVGLSTTKYVWRWRQYGTGFRLLAGCQKDVGCVGKMSAYSSVSDEFQVTSHFDENVATKLPRLRLSMSADRRTGNSADAKNRNIPKLAKMGHRENRISGLKMSNQYGFSITLSQRLSNGKFGLIRTKKDESHGCWSELSKLSGR